MRTFLNIFLDEFTAIPIVHSLCSWQYPTNFKTFCSWAFFRLILPFLFKQYSRDVKICVKEITGVTLGRELVRRCGNEGQHRYLDAACSFYTRPSPSSLMHWMMGPTCATLPLSCHNQDESSLFSRGVETGNRRPVW